MELLLKKRKLKFRTIGLKFNSLRFVFLHIFLPVFLTGLGFSSYALEKETVDRLTNENRVLSSAYELHISAADSAIVNGTVSLDHEDAWLFFDNIRPSEVISTYKSSILINGEAFVNGWNSRMVIYKHGTVIMPHGSNYKPLTVYTEKDFQGNQNSYAPNVYNNNLGEFDNAIKSFKLKRGYMVTFATSSDGTGYSRVFIANDADLEVNLPDLLSGKVSFIRVFKYEWVTKKGWAGWNEAEWEITQSTWRYDWNAGGVTTNNTEYVPIKQNLGWPGWDVINSKNNVSHLLGYNEPDHTEQSDVTVDEAIAAWPEYMKSGLRLGAPATTDFNWVIEFVKKCDELNYRVDFVAVHAYWGNNPSSYYSSLNWVHQATGRPIWITEWNYGANWTNEWWPDNTWQLTAANEQYAYQKIKAIVDFFDDTPWIERYSIYNWVEDRRAVVLNGELTKAGEYYANNKSVEAFNKSYEVIPRWTYSKPELSFRYFPLRNSIRLNWTNPNGELSQKFIIEKKIGDGNFEAIYATDDPTEDFYLDPLDQNQYGFITYRLKLQTTQGSYLTSNVVSYYQTAGENEVQVGNFDINSLDINTAYFSKRYLSAPVTILGIPSSNNSFPMTQRLNSVSTSAYDFIFHPWNYLSNIQITEPDILSTMSLPAGNYDFDGLQAEVQKVTGVSREWTTITFNETFEQVPVVFCTIGSRTNFYPLTIAVRNITTSGFEISLKSEETNTAELSTEIVNFFAIEPGVGVLDGKRITVGRNYGEIGISSEPVEILYDSTYSEPAVFAGLLSAEDNFASTLRYSKSGDSSIEIMKQRELSGGESAMQTDEFGWMVMDLAAGQSDIGTDANEIGLKSRIHFYPNPAKDILYFNFTKPTRVQIFDLSGRMLLESAVSNSLNISTLSRGVYLMKANGKYFGKLISVN